MPLAIDSSAPAVQTHRRNFAGSEGIVADLVELGPAGVLNLVAANIRRGSRIGVIGGPPCQGFSRANTRAQTDDREMHCHFCTLI